MKRRSSSIISLNFCIICLLILIIILMAIYIFGQKNNQTTKTTQVQQPDVITTALEYDYYNFLPRRLFRNFYDNDYYDYNRPVVIQQDTKPIYINVPPQQSAPSQNNLNLFNYPPKQEQKFETNVSPPPSISPPPLSGVSSTSLSNSSISNEGSE